MNGRYERESLTVVAYNDEPFIPKAILSRLGDGRWSPNGKGGGIIRNTAKDQRPNNKSLWV